jgi:hypothetical protein
MIRMAVECMAVERMDLSARAYHPVLKLSRTIADLAGSEPVQQAHHDVRVIVGLTNEDEGRNTRRAASSIPSPLHVTLYR